MEGLDSFMTVQGGCDSAVWSGLIYGLVVLLFVMVLYFIWKSRHAESMYDGLRTESDYAVGDFDGELETMYDGLRTESDYAVGDFDGELETMYDGLRTESDYAVGDFDGEVETMEDEPAAVQTKQVVGEVDGDHLQSLLY